MQSGAHRCQHRRAASRRFDIGGSLDPSIEHVGKVLRKPVVGDHPAVDPEPFPRRAVGGERLGEIDRAHRDRLQRRANEVRPGRAKGQSMDRALEVGPPIGRAQSCKGGHDRHPGSVGYAARQRFGRGGVLHQPQPIAQPLHQAARHEHRTFQRIGRRFAVQCGQQRRQQPVARSRAILPGRRQREEARPECRLGAPDRKTALPDGRRLLIARHAPHADRRAEQPTFAQLAGHGDDAGQSRWRHAEEVAKPLVPAPRFQVHERGATGVAGVGRVVARQLEEKPTIDRPQPQPSAVAGRTHVGDILHQPGHLGRAEIGVEQKAGRLLHKFLVPLVAQIFARARGAAVLPDQRRSERLARSCIPRHHGLALVGDADRGDMVGPTRGCNCLD